MSGEKSELIVSEDVIMSKIYCIRDHKVMLDEDLAELYDVETKQLKRQVRRNMDRFPEDFMFELTREEFENLRCQIGSSSWGGARYIPMAFTEQGVAMLSSVLNSSRAIKVNIQIIRIFTRMRELLMTNKDILLKLEQLERKVDGHDENIQIIFAYLKNCSTRLNSRDRASVFGEKMNGSSFVQRISTNVPATISRPPAMVFPSRGSFKRIAERTIASATLSLSIGATLLTGPVDRALK